MEDFAPNPERERSTLCVHEVDIYCRLLTNVLSGWMDLEVADTRFLLRCYLAVLDFTASAIAQHLDVEAANVEVYEILKRMMEEERHG